MEGGFLSRADVSSFFKKEKEISNEQLIEFFKVESEGLSEMLQYYEKREEVKETTPELDEICTKLCINKKYVCKRFKELQPNKADGFLMIYLDYLKERIATVEIVFFLLRFKNNKEYNEVTERVFKDGNLFKKLLHELVRNKNRPMFSEEEEVFELLWFKEQLLEQKILSKSLFIISYVEADSNVFEETIRKLKDLNTKNKQQKWKEKEIEKLLKENETIQEMILLTFLLETKKHNQVELVQVSQEHVSGIIKVALYNIRNKKKREQNLVQITNKDLEQIKTTLEGDLFQERPESTLYRTVYKTVLDSYLKDSCCTDYSQVQMFSFCYSRIFSLDEEIVTRFVLEEGEMFAAEGVFNLAVRFFPFDLLLVPTLFSSLVLPNRRTSQGIFRFFSSMSTLATKYSYSQELFKETAEKGRVNVETKEDVEVEVNGVIFSLSKGTKGVLIGERRHRIVVWKKRYSFWRMLFDILEQEGKYSESLISFVRTVISSSGLMIQLADHLVMQENKERNVAEIFLQLLSKHLQNKEVCFDLMVLIGLCDGIEVEIRPDEIEHFQLVRKGSELTSENFQLIQRILLSEKENLVSVYSKFITRLSSWCASFFDDVFLDVHLEKLIHLVEVNEEGEEEVLLFIDCSREGFLSEKKVCEFFERCMITAHDSCLMKRLFTRFKQTLRLFLTKQKIFDQIIKNKTREREALELYSSETPFFDLIAPKLKEYLLSLIEEGSEQNLIERISMAVVFADCFNQRCEDVERAVGCVLLKATDQIKEKKAVRSLWNRFVVLVEASARRSFDLKEDVIEAVSVGFDQCKERSFSVVVSIATNLLNRKTQEEKGDSSVVSLANFVIEEGLKFYSSNKEIFKENFSSICLLVCLLSTNKGQSSRASIEAFLLSLNTFLERERFSFETYNRMFEACLLMSRKPSLLAVLDWIVFLRNKAGVVLYQNIPSLFHLVYVLVSRETTLLIEHSFIFLSLFFESKCSSTYFDFFYSFVGLLLQKTDAKTEAVSKLRFYFFGSVLRSDLKKRLNSAKDDSVKKAISVFLLLAKTKEIHTEIIYSGLIHHLCADSRLEMDFSVLLLCVRLLNKLIEDQIEEKTLLVQVGLFVSSNYQKLQTNNTEVRCFLITCSSLSYIQRLPVHEIIARLLE